MAKQAGNPETHLTAEQMRGYQGRTLSPDERRQAGAHLADCGRCRRALLQRVGPVALPPEAAALAEPLHLEYEELAALLDGKLAAADRERVEEHLLICTSCAHELDGLKLLEIQLAGKVAVAQQAAQPKAAVRQVAAPAVSSGTRTAAKPEPKPSLAERLTNFFAAPGRLREFGLAGALAVVGVVLLTSVGGGADVTGSAVRGAARLIDLGSQPFTGTHIGGYILIALGAGLLAYSLLRKR